VPIGRGYIEHLQGRENSMKFLKGGATGMNL